MYSTLLKKDLNPPFQYLVDIKELLNGEYNITTSEYVVIKWIQV